MIFSNPGYSLVSNHQSHCDCYKQFSLSTAIPLRVQYQSETASDYKFLTYTNNTLCCFSLYYSLTIIVQIAPIVLLIINFASDVHDEHV